MSGRVACLCDDPSSTELSSTGMRSLCEGRRSYEVEFNDAFAKPQLSDTHAGCRSRCSQATGHEPSVRVVDFRIAGAVVSQSGYSPSRVDWGGVASSSELMGSGGRPNARSTAPLGCQRTPFSTVAQDVVSEFVSVLLQYASTAPSDGGICVRALSTKNGQR